MKEKAFNKYPAQHNAHNKIGTFHIPLPLPFLTQETGEVSYPGSHYLPVVHRGLSYLLLNGSFLHPSLLILWTENI